MEKIFPDPEDGEKLAGTFLKKNQVHTTSGTLVRAKAKKALYTYTYIYYIYLYYIYYIYVYIFILYVTYKVFSRRKFRKNYNKIESERSNKLTITK